MGKDALVFPVGNAAVKPFNGAFRDGAVLAHEADGRALRQMVVNKVQHTQAVARAAGED